MHHTKDKGDLAVIKTMLDLTEKGFSCYLPVSEHMPVDLIVISQDNPHPIRIQVKYSSDGFIKSKTTWADKNGTHTKKYSENDFDYFAIYLPEIDRVIYPSIKYRGCTIRTSLPKITCEYYFWEDFISFTDLVVKKRKIQRELPKPFIKARIKHNNVKKKHSKKPSKNELKKLIWQHPMTKLGEMFNVSDVAVAKWIKSYNLKKPKIGYWIKKS